MSLYPTYQLYAAMGSKQTAPRDGLRLAALATMEWLRQRIQDDIPAELCQRGLMSTGRQMTAIFLRSTSIAGYVLDIVSLPEKGVWSLQITEPDLGSDPGKKEQRRAAVPGRVIETNVAFRIYGKELECGFQTVVSDPEGTSPQAEVYRLAVVRRLMENPAFGLTQILRVNGSVTEVENSSADQKADHADQHTGKSAPCGGVYLLSEAMHGVACQKYRAQGAEYIAPADARYLFGPAGNALRGTIQLANRSPAAGGRTYTALRRSCLCREDERVLPDLSAGCRFVARPCQGGGGCV